MERDEIIIRNAITHVLNTANNIVHYSEDVLELGPDLNDFIREHIFKIAKADETKKCYFMEEESRVYPLIRNFKEANLVKTSRELAEQLCEIMSHNVNIPAADLVVATYQFQSIMYLAILKLNYKENFIHAVLDGRTEIKKQMDILPASTSRLKEAVLINLSTLEIQLLEKKYEINGVKTNYFSSLFLGCRTELSQKNKYELLTKAISTINTVYYEHDFEKQMEVKSVLQESLAEEGSINIPELSEKIYGENIEAKEEFREKLEKYHCEKEEVAPQSASIVRKLERQTLFTDAGIEIHIPMEIYNTGDTVKCVTNADGTVSLTIKNINQIRVAF